MVSSFGDYILPMPENWDDAKINTEKHNWQVVRDVFNGKAGEYLTPDLIDQMVEDVKLKYGDEVDSFEALPSNDPKNTVRSVADEGRIYIYDGMDWRKFQSIDLDKVNEVDSRLSSQKAEIIVSEAEPTTDRDIFWFEVKPNV